MLAFTALALAPAGAAVPRVDDASLYTRYVRARAADAAGRTEAAAQGYAAVLAAVPDDSVLALRTYRQALAAGDRALAVRTARTLDAARLLPPDGRLLLLADALLAKDWKVASTAIDRIAQEGVYGFAVPVLRAWIAQEGRSDDPLALLDAARGDGAVAIAYAAEHRALILLARGRTAEGVAAVRALSAAGGGRAVRVQLAAAAALARTDRSGALALLAGNDPTLSAARRRLAEGKPPAGGMTTAEEGIGALLTRIAVDINRERVTPVSLTLARIATFLAPGNAETWIVTAEILASAEQYDAALAALAEVRPADPFAEAARFSRIQLLVRRGEAEKALEDALAMARASGATADDWVRVGQVQSELDRHADAADSFGRALAIADAAGMMGDRWSLLLQRGGALDRAGNWPAAKALLEEAVRIAPDQASALNYLGYAQLERRINLPEAEKLIERASRLRPDDAAITDSLGWTYFLRGNVAKAIQTLEAAIATEPGEPTINEHLGDAYWTNGRKLEARYAWRAALVFADAKDAARLRVKIDMGWTPAVAAP